jgi:chromosome segregation protein
LYFKRIDIQGFKSFAEPVSIEFHEGITCIVGPNGSGKSNIADAIRWVLGEQSPKMLRGGKMEEVIFAGTENRKSRGMAEVTLVIDNTSHILPIDYSEVAITRRMYRSGESGYYINKVPCRLRDIRELIMDTGIGVDGYSIIGQGRIADILSDKPEGRRQIFEEAAGIVKYRSKKEESERKLEASKTNLDRVNDIIGEIESRIDGLKEDSIKASEYLELRERYKNIEVNIILKNIENLELKNEYIKDDLSELAHRINETGLQRESVDKDIAENRIRNEELEALSNTGRDRLLALVEEINTLSSQNQLRRERLASIEKDKERLEAELASFDLRREREEKNAVELSANLERLNAEYEALKSEADEKSKHVACLEAAAIEAQGLMDANKDRIYECHSRASEKKSEINSLLSLKDTLTKRREQVCSENEDGDAAGISLAEEYRQLQAERDEAATALEQLEQENLQVKSTYSEAMSREKLITHELGERKVAIGQLSARYKMIEEMESAYEGYNEAVKFVMKSGLEGMQI